MSLAPEMFRPSTEPSFLGPEAMLKLSSSLLEPDELEEDELSSLSAITRRDILGQSVWSKMNVLIVPDTMYPITTAAV